MAYLLNEINFTRNRIHAMLRTEFVLMNATIVQSIGGGKHLNEVLEKLDGPG